MVRSYSGPASGVGAISQWDSKSSAGKGRMAIAKSAAPATVKINVDFVRPFTAHNLNTFTLSPAGNASTVTWAMEGTNVFMLKVISVFVNGDRMMGKHFETGLDNLRTIAEK